MTGWIIVLLLALAGMDLVLLHNNAKQADDIAMLNERVDSAEEKLKYLEASYDELDTDTAQLKLKMNMDEIFQEGDDRR